MITMAIQYMFLEILKIEPGHATQLIAYSNLPWTPKLLYGIITDCLPICGSGKRAYVVLMGMFQSLSMLTLFLFKIKSPGLVCLLATMQNLGGAFMDVVVDGMMVINSKSDPTGGSEDLQSYSWMFYGLGGITGCGASALFLSGHDPVTGEANGNPYPCFLMMTVFGGLVGISGFFIDKKLEANQGDLLKMGFKERTKFVFGEVWQGLKMKEIYSVALYMIVLGSFVPWFGTYLYYYQITVTGFE
jgi:hypothetical protein